MDWTDDGFVISARPHGEHGLIVGLLTREHGRHLGIARAGRSRATRATWQLGTRVAAAWRARLEDHLGGWSGEPIGAGPALLLDDPGRLAALSAACAIADAALPEREPHRRSFDGFAVLIEALAGADWPHAYALWELDLLTELGFGLDLSQCGATGTREDLRWVSPRTGRAVSGAAGAPYADRLLPLPAFLRGEPGGSARDALILTGHFLETQVMRPQTRPMPAARDRLLDRLARSDTVSGRRNQT